MLKSLGSLILVGVALSACGERGGEEAAPGDAAAETPVVYTTFYPTEYFTSRIAGDIFKVVCPVPDGEDPITWRPSREQIAAYRDADLIIVNGAGFEQWVETASLPPSRIVDTAAPLEDELITYETVTHSHGPDGEHTHEGIDGHTWVDPVSAKRQAEAILTALIAESPGEESRLREGFGALGADLDALHERFQEVAAALGDRTLLCSHPAYNYAARRYGWSIRNFDFDPDAPLSQAQFDELAGAAPAILLWESEPQQDTAAALAGIDIVSVTFSPCELLDREARQSGEDYMTVMRGNLDRLGAAIEQLRAPGR